MIVITERDQAIKSFLNEVQVASTKTLHTLFFGNTSIRNCTKRLKQLVDIKFIKVYRQDMLSQNVYYSKNKPKNINHKILFSRLLGKLKEQNIEVIKYKCPYKIGEVIADGLIVIRVNEEVKIYFVECEISKRLNTKKYEELYYSRKYKEKMPVMGSILLISNKGYTESNVLDIKTCKLDFSDLKLD